MLKLQTETRGQYQMRPQITGVKRDISIVKQVHARQLHAGQNTFTTTWLDEWQTAPEDPLPSNIKALSLLNEPAVLYLDNHERQAQKVFLAHYQWDMPPEGRAQQERKERANRNCRQDPRDDGQQAQRTKERQRVIKAAQSAYTIDLTENDTVHMEVLRPILDNSATRPHCTLISTSNSKRRSPSRPTWKDYGPETLYHQEGRAEFPQAMFQQQAYVRGVPASYKYTLSDDRYAYECYR